MTCATCVGRVEKALTACPACTRPASTWPPSRPPSSRRGTARRRRRWRAAVVRAGYEVPQATLRLAHRRHDLRQLRRPRREGAATGARRARRQRQPGHQHRPSVQRLAGTAADALLAAVQRAGYEAAHAQADGAPPARAPRPRGLARGARRAAVGAAGAADARRPVRAAHWMLPALWQFAARHAGAVLARRALLPRRLEGAARRQPATWTCWSRWAPAPPTA